MACTGSSDSLILKLNNRLVFLPLISRNLVNRVELFQRLSNDSDSLSYVFLGDDQGRGKPDTKISTRLIVMLNESTHMLTCVGLASNLSLASSWYPEVSIAHPFDFINKHNCHAVLPFLEAVSSMTTPLNNPRPRMILMKGLLRSFNPCLKISPSLADRSAKFSLTNTSKAVIATAQPRGFLESVESVALTHPPYVDPCSPGLIQSMTSFELITHETGYTRVSQVK